MRVQVDNYPQFDGQAMTHNARSPLAPGHQMRLRTRSGNMDGQSLQITLELEIDGDRIPVFTEFFSQDRLADMYEKAHHEHHGYDARGLDPRTERTRLTP